jgi:hypothetical protein
MADTRHFPEVSEPDGHHRVLLSIRSRGTFMILAAIASIAIGLLLALRFKVFILLPAMLVTCAALGSAGLIWGVSGIQIALEMVTLTTALQLGYVAPLYYVAPTYRS